MNQLLITLGVVLGVVAFWWMVCFFLAAFSGWRRIHHLFGAPPGPVPSGRHLLSGKFGMVSYRNILSIACDQNGLYLSVFILFRPGHPPLFIPWAAIRSAERKDGFFAERVRFSVLHDEDVQVTLPLRALQGTPLALPTPPRKRA